MNNLKNFLYIVFVACIVGILLLLFGKDNESLIKVISDVDDAIVLCYIVGAVSMFALVVVKTSINNKVHIEKEKEYSVVRDDIV